MIRTSRFHLVVVVLSVLALVSVSSASAGPLAAAPAAHPAREGFFAAALHWLADLVGLHGSPTPGLEDPVEKGGKLPLPTGTSCIDPAGLPKPCIEIGW